MYIYEVYYFYISIHALCVGLIFVSRKARKFQRALESISSVRFGFQRVSGRQYLVYPDAPPRLAPRSGRQELSTRPPRT